MSRNKELQKQVYIYSLDTSSFYNDEENTVHLKMLKLYKIRGIIRNKIKKSKREIDNFKSEKITKTMKDTVERREFITKYIKTLRERQKKINILINEQKIKLTSLFEKFEGVRTLRPESIKHNKKIGMFQSTLTRTFGMKTDEVSESLFVVRVFYFRVLQDLIENGFFYGEDNKHYEYFSSSAGQIRTKKCVFAESELMRKHENSLMCGLTVDKINEKDGCNINKLLAYKALTTSASQEWRNFDIKKAIVVDDMETMVTSTFDIIDTKTYEITTDEKSVPIEHTDGCGMILPSNSKQSKKAFMCRLPFVKGLLVPFPYNKFENKKVKDIYGKEWDIEKDDIRVIFTKSQFKMHKYYSSWEDYQDNFIKYNCQAVKLNEEDIGEDANLTYQMLQTLTDVTDEELKNIAQNTIDDIETISRDKDTMLRMLGATEENSKKRPYQQALMIYPEMLNDDHSIRMIKDKKKSLIKDARSAKLRVNGKYTYLIPDLYAFCERLFNDVENPNGLLENGQVYCKIFKEGTVDILRSPHLYKEHALRFNKLDESFKDWFITDGIYTSIKDPISRILQFDNDGDKGLVIQGEYLEKVVERNMKGVNPLYYEMASAKPSLVNNKEIYDSLLLAFKANIGEYSNNISKCFNEDEVDLDVVRWLTMENNFEIDYAKTLFKLKRPDHVEEKIVEYTRKKVPYFFIHAKDKEKRNVQEYKSSTVNRLSKIIKNSKIDFESVAGEFDYTKLMSGETFRHNKNLVKKYDQLNRSKKWIMRGSEIKDRNEGTLFVFKYIRDELLKIEPNVTTLVDVLVDELYGRRKSINKETLWGCFGDEILYNIQVNLNNTKQCESCGDRIEVVNSQTKYCKPCFNNKRKEYIKNKVKEHRSKNVNN